MARIQALLLDADGVVQLPHAGWENSVASLCGNQERAEDFVRDVFAAEEPSLVGDSDFASDLGAVLARWNSPFSIDEALRIWTQITPDQNVLDCVTWLRSTGLLVCIASNQQEHRASYMASQLEFEKLFDHLFFSCDIGHKKPSPDYFDALLARLNVPGANALFVDDHQANVDAARAVGISSERFHLSMSVAKFYRILKKYHVPTPSDE